MMRRRTLVAALGGVAGTWPVAVRAPQRAMPVVGLLLSGLNPPELLARYLTHAPRTQRKAFPVIDYVSRAQQQQSLPRIGWLLLEHSIDNPSAVAGFRQGLTDGPIAMSTLRPQLNQLGRQTR